MRPGDGLKAVHMCVRVYVSEFVYLLFVVVVATF